MVKYLGLSFLITLVLVISNYVILGKNKVSKILGMLSFIYSFIHIIINNIYYYDLVYSQEYYINLYSDFMLELQLTFIIVALIEVILLFILKNKIRFNLYKMITISLFICTMLTLIVFKGIIITKTIVDISTYAWVLIINYINFINIPIYLFKKNKNDSV